MKSIEKKFRRYRFFREGRKKVLHIFLSLKFPESESQFWTLSEGKSICKRKSPPGPLRSIPRVLLLRRNCAFFFLAQEKHCFQYCKERTLSSTYMFGNGSDSGANKEKDEKSPRKVSKDRNIHQPQNNKKYPCEEIASVCRSGQWIFQ